MNSEPGIPLIRHGLRPRHLLPQGEKEEERFRYFLFLFSISPSRDN